MFSSPCNPTGSVYSKEELAGLVEVFERHPNIFILSDEIYEHINFVDKHVSIAEFKSIKAVSYTHLDVYKRQSHGKK